MLVQPGIQRFSEGVYAISCRMTVMTRMFGDGFNATSAEDGGTRSMQILGV